MGIYGIWPTTMGFKNTPCGKKPVGWKSWIRWALKNGKCRVTRGFSMFE
jgi:hypothetical protein